VIKTRLKDHGLELNGVEVIDPAQSPKLEAYAEVLYALRNRRGVTRKEAGHLLRNPNMFGAVMVHLGDADAMVAGIAQHYPDTIRPALQVIRVKSGARVAGVYMMVFQNDVKFFADTTVNIEPTPEDLAKIAIEAAEVAERFEVAPRVAMLSFSNFGSAKHPLVDKVRRAVELVRQQKPDLVIDGEMQADTAVVREIIEGTYSFSRLKEAANVLVFPSLEAGNIAYKLIQRLADAKAVGPILVGLSKPVHVLQRGAEVDEIVDMAAIAAVEAQSVCERSRE
jgi:malate dehydrogenase (oxaloacetate-decarboxylating)(NADP+)